MVSEDDDKAKQLLEKEEKKAEGCCGGCWHRIVNSVACLRKVNDWILKKSADNEARADGNCHYSWCSWWKYALLWFFFLLFWWELFRGILQFIMFHFATMGCSASALTNYRYAGGGWTCPRHYEPEVEFDQWQSVISDDPHNTTACKYTPADNVVPELSLLLEQASSLFHLEQSYAVFPNTAGAATIDRAQVGMWWRTYGPWFWTYTYQDMHSRTSLYMRPTLMGMMGLYSETRIMRCDGQGDVWFFGEGSNWIGNRIRTFFGNVFGLQREGSFNIYQNSDHFGTAIETFHGQKSITFQKGTGTSQVTLGSTVLTANADHPHRDMWSLHKEGGPNYREFPPYYVTSAASVLMAFRWMAIRHERGIAGGASGAQAATAPNFLAQESNASATFFEEAEEEVHRDAEPDEQLAGGEKVLCTSKPASSAH
jgi:hypothetical protein